MTMRTVCIANQKGGVGKTTTVAGLAGALAAQGSSVLLIDLDPHASLSHWFRMAKEPPLRGSFEVYSAEAPVADVVYHTAESRISLMPAQPALATLERAGATQPNLGRALLRALGHSSVDYDYVLLDCPPTLGVLMVSALAAADVLIVPTQTEPLALRSLDGMLKTAAMVERSRGRPFDMLVVPTMHDKRTRVALDSLAELRARPGCTVWDSEIPTDTRLREASRNGVSPTAFDPTSRGAQAFAHLARWLNPMIRQEATARPQPSALQEHAA